MKLNHRILLLIAPVILLSAAASSYIIYSSQKDALLKRTDSYLQLNMEKLASHFRQTRALLNSYSFTLAKSDILRHYFEHENNPYRELELVDNLNETIDILQPSDVDFVALSILDEQHNELYYAENSNDPFARFDPKVKHFVEQQFKQTHNTSNVSYTENSGGEGVLVRYDVLDTQTLQTPLSYNRDEIFFVVVYVTLDKFNALRRQIEFDNQSPLFFQTQPPQKPQQLTQSVELQPDMYAILDPAPLLLRQHLNSIQKELMMSFGLSALITVILLLMLLYKHMINPILRLDEQLQEVENKQRKNIELRDSDDEIGRLSARFYAMYAELDSSYQQTKTLAEFDHLTKLANRRQFHHKAEKTLLDIPGNHHLWVLYIDLDNFKYVNDKYGHQVGDSLLINFASHVRLVCEEFELYQVSSLAARLSGDEFAILLSAPADGAHYADDFAQRLLDPIQSRDHSPLSHFPITASIGIATYPQDGVRVEKLLLNSDTAMYQAKNAGKNQIAHYSQQLDDIVKRRNDIERALREQNFDQEFSLVYQPYFTCSGHKVAGFEVLLRWFSPQLGEVAADEFIPIAEQTGLFGIIDRWVIQSAFADFNTLSREFSQPVQLSINLSSAELDSKNLAQFIEQHARYYDLEPYRIEFEITETFAANSQSYPLLDELSKQGFGLTIDDFGSGYTSIAQLVQYPVQKIKFDRQFLDTLLSTNKQQVIKPLIELCHSQGIEVTAEGIESVEMHHWLAEYQCDFMQGYFFGKPMTLTEIRNWQQYSESNQFYAQSDHCFT